MTWKDIHHSPTVRTVLATLGVVIVLLVVFKLGEGYGFHRARFSQRFGDNFHDTFVGPRAGDMFGMMDGDTIPGGHGAVGKVVSVTLPRLTVAGPDNLEKTVVLSDDTLIRKFADTASNTDIAVGDYVVVLGDPTDNGEIDARLIRIVPAPQNAPVSGSASSTAPAPKAAATH